MKHVELAAIPLSLYRKTMNSVVLENPNLYAKIFNKFGSGNNPNNKYRIYIPLGQLPVLDVKVTPSKVVLDYLEAKNYKVDNYMLGTAIMPDGKRTTKIGKILSSEPAIKKAFDNDAARKGAKAASDGSMLLVISRHPYDILGSSFDRDWTSCTNLKGGENAKIFTKSLRFGLLVAYLIKNNDKNINRPVSRIIIRPYFNSTGVLISMDSNEYGSAPAAFRKTLSKFVTWANSSAKSGMYNAPKGMYLDQEPPEVGHKLSLDKITKPSQVQFVEDPQILVALLSRKTNNQLDFISAVMQNPNAPLEILMLGAKDSDEDVRGAVMQNPNAPPEILMLGAKDYQWTVRGAATENPNVTPEILAIGARDQKWYIRKAVMQNPKATTEILMLGARDSDWNVRKAATENPKATTEILMLGARDNEENVRLAAMYNPNVTPEILAIGARDNEENVRLAAMSNAKYRKEGATTLHNIVVAALARTEQASNMKTSKIVAALVERTPYLDDAAALNNVKPPLLPELLRN